LWPLLVGLTALRPPQNCVESLGQAKFVKLSATGVTAAGLKPVPQKQSPRLLKLYWNPSPVHCTMHSSADKSSPVNCWNGPLNGVVKPGFSWYDPRFSTATSTSGPAEGAGAADG
jgi:hypothetical protein